MYSFDGDFRPGKPKVSISGRSQTQSQNDVIRAAKEARQKRERDRKRVESATVIQAAFRGYRSRADGRRRYWDDFETRLKEVSSSLSSSPPFSSSSQIFKVVSSAESPNSVSIH